MFVIAQILSLLINLYIAVIIIYVAVTWLINFKVLNTENQQARNLVELLERTTDPVMKPVQKYVPPIGGIDLTPLIVIIGLEILKSVIWSIFV
jgi:YggT family protein